MSQESVEVVRADYEEFSRGDFSRWAELPDDFEFVASPELPDAGTYRGEAARRWLTAWLESFDQLTIEATEVIGAGGDNIVVGVLQRSRPRGSQSIVEGRWWAVTTLRGGEVVRSELLPHRREAFEAVGLRE